MSAVNSAKTNGNTIKEKAGIKDDSFQAMESYPDKDTYDLVGAAAETLGISGEQVLQAFGGYWTKFTAKEGYGELMEMFGSNFLDACQNLNNLHARMGMAMPDLKPPRFNCTEVTNDSFILEYHSERDGLAPMMLGMLDGMAEKYDTKIEVKHHPKSATQVDKFEVKILSKGKAA